LGGGSMQIFNKHSELEKRRQLRNNAPPAEVKLWHALKGKQVAGYKFRRQYSVGAYVLDFYCPALKLALEIDGSSHNGDDAQEYDRQRQQFVEALGIRFLRFTNAEVHRNLEGVVAAILATTPQPPPS